MITRLDRITQRAREHRREVFTNLYHHLDEEVLAQCFRELKSGKAPGVDGVTKAEYGENLEANLPGLVYRLKRKAYRPQPCRRREIPKGKGRTRPLGIPATEDKLVQRGLAKILERVYEEDFYDFSYGFRPGRSCHDALRELSRCIGTKKVSVVVEADIKGFYDNIDHEWLLKMVAHRVSDPNVHWLLRRFLKAGVLVQGKHLATEKGAPQGASLSPLLANVYLHYALDDWFAQVVTRESRGEAYLVRYADDFIACFQYKEDARRFRSSLQERLARFKLEVEPSKTRVMEFGRFAKSNAKRHGESAPVFDFLGFTHYCGTSRWGRFRLKWRTAKNRYRSKLRAMKEWIRTHRTLPLKEIWTAVNRKLVGHYRYYGVSDNAPWLRRFREAVREMLAKWLNRRGGRKSFTMERFAAFEKRYPLARPERLICLYSVRG